MSRVIKSGHLKMESPRLINASTSDVEMAAAGEEIPEITEGKVEIDDITQVTKQAEEIIKETEEMVKELLGTAREEAEKIIKKAKEEADKLIQDGNNTLKNIQDQGYNDGWQAGFQEGNQKAQEEMKTKLQSAQKTLENAEEERKKILFEAEDEILQLATSVAGKIINQEVQTDSQVIINIVKKALDKVCDRDEITIRVNPDNMDAVINAREEIEAASKGIKKIKEQADPSISQGGCVIETANGNVDARVESQLAEIEQSLLEVNSNG